MKTHIILFALVCLIFSTSNAQTNQELAYQKAREAIKLMDEGKLDESIVLLKESQKLDPENIHYSYEMALAYTYKKDYKKSISILKKVLKKSEANSQFYQLLGNSYSMSGNKVKALKTYAEGLDVFPNSGNLYLEAGNISLMAEDYEQAIQFYEKGVEVDPEFPSNYYRLALLFLHSSDKLSGLIYGEIFMNLERTTSRTVEMSKLLFETYDSSVEFMGDSIKTDFCQIVIIAEDFDPENFKLPFCGVFGQHFIMATVGQTEMNLKSLAEMRSTFIDLYFDEENEVFSGAKIYPNVLYSYHQMMKENKVFNAYNHYLFQMARENEFVAWKEENSEEYDAFVEWYTDEENYLTIGAENTFLRR
ncbi:MAG: hypothetical protein KDD63_02890 [Bacteroidetes bacterium]|nr:hypothetical protein [Bacteroidota bacterium]MCB0851165.1 hypothetical protein [Bacteroidota bacterium]